MLLLKLDGYHICELKLTCNGCYLSVNNYCMLVMMVLLILVIYIIFWLYLI